MDWCNESWMESDGVEMMSLEENVYYEQLRISIEFHEKEAASLRQRLERLVNSDSGKLSVIGEVTSDAEDRKQIMSIMSALKEAK